MNASIYIYFIDAPTQNFPIFGLINIRNSAELFGVNIEQNYTIKLNFQIKLELCNRFGVCTMHCW